MSKSVFQDRARIAAAARYRPADDPDLLAMRAQFKSERLAEHIREVVASAPPFTPEQRDTIISAFGLVAA